MAKAPSAIRRLTQPMKMGVGAGALLLLGVIYYFLFHVDVTDSLEQAKVQHAKLMKDLNDARLAEQAYQKDLAELAEREQRQRELNKILPSSTEYPAFLSAVQSAANLSGVSLSAWTPRQEVPGQFYARVPMKVELSGRFHQIARFFYNVGQLDRIINMEDISITDPKLAGTDVMLRADALATAFHLIEEAAPSDTARKARKDRQQ